MITAKVDLTAAMRRCTAPLARVVGPLVYFSPLCVWITVGEMSYGQALLGRGERNTFAKFSFAGRGTNYFYN